MLSLIAAAIVSFIGTNVDDVVMLTILLFIAEKRWKVVAGQYIGMMVLIAISILGSYSAALFLSDYIWLLGFIPIVLGIRAIFARDDGNDVLSNKVSMLGTAAITISNGSDNIGVYIPLFAQYDIPHLLMLLSIYFIGIAVLCFAAACISDIKGIREAVGRYRRFIVPTVLISIGIMIVIQQVLWDIGSHYLPPFS